MMIHIKDEQGRDVVGVEAEAPTHERRALDVVEAVASNAGITREQLLGRNRGREFVRPRQDLMRILRHDYGMPYPQIGRLLDRDHTTIIHGVKASEARQ